MNTNQNNTEFSNPSNYNDSAFWNKVKQFAKKAGAKVIYYALLLYYAHASLKTPVWARMVILGALAYFICPFDLTPDIIPFIGFLDDLAILVAALKAVQICITPEVKSDAKTKLAEWFDDVDEAELA